MEIKVPKWCHSPSGTFMSIAELPPTRNSLQNSCAKKKKIKLWAVFFIFFLTVSADQSSAWVCQTWDPCFQGCSSLWWKSNGDVCAQMGSKVLSSLLGKFHIVLRCCYIDSPAFIKCCNAKCLIFVIEVLYWLFTIRHKWVIRACWFGCETVGPAWNPVAVFQRIIAWNMGAYHLCAITLFGTTSAIANLQ